MSEMVERVAGAIMRAYFSRPVEEQTVLNVSVPDQEDLARAAIAAMREPTDAMKSVEGIHWGYGCHVCGGVKEGWQAMIDEALR